MKMKKKESNGSDGDERDNDVIARKRFVCVVVSG